MRSSKMHPALEKRILDQLCARLDVQHQRFWLYDERLSLLRSLKILELELARELGPQLVHRASVLIDKGALHIAAQDGVHATHAIALVCLYRG